MGIINTRYRRHTGTLWDSRYKSSLIQAKLYLLTCMRYIEINATPRAYNLVCPRLLADYWIFIDST